MNNGSNTLILPEGYAERQLMDPDLEFSYAEALDLMLREYGRGLADLELARDDIGWDKLGASRAMELSPDTRINIVNRAREYWYRDPLAKQTIRLWTDYGIGKGITWKAREESTGDVLREKLWGHKDNRMIFSPTGQRMSSNKLLVDGELFLVLFVGPDGIKVRRVDPLQIVEVLCDPEDEETPRYYKRERTSVNAGLKTMVYADWQSDGDGSVPDSQGQAQAATEEALVFHVAMNTLGRRGISLLAPMMDWSKAYRKFMEARASIVQALSQFAWEGKVKGGSAAVTALRNQFRSNFAAGGDTETNPTPARGATLFTNQSLDMNPIKTDTGAANAQTDGNMLLGMAGAGVGIFPHYYGAGEAFRLATATAMETPMLKEFESYQELWIGEKGIYQQLFDFTCETYKVSEDKWFVDIDAPPIVQDDVPALIHAQLEATQAFPSIADADEFKKLVLTTLGINNPNEVLDALRKEEEERKKEREKTAEEELAKMKAEQEQNQNQPPQPGDNVPPQEPQEMQPQQAVKLAQEVRKLTEALRGV